jgi:hypothetical protein
MELAILVYLVDLVINLGKALGVVVFVSVIFAVGGLMITAMVLDNLNEGDFKPFYMKHFVWWKTGLAAAIITLLIPSENTIKYMGAAYLIQSTYESGFVQEAGGLTGKVVTNQLRKWAESNPDIDSLLESVGETKGKLETVIPAGDE